MVIKNLQVDSLNVNNTDNSLDNSVQQMQIEKGHIDVFCESEMNRNEPKTNSNLDTIEDIPVEILEFLLNYLEKTDILCAANVCILWKQICQRLLRERCHLFIPSDILTEIMADQDGGAESLRLLEEGKDGVEGVEGMKVRVKLELRKTSLSQVDWVEVWYKWVESHIGSGQSDDVRCGNFKELGEEVMTVWAIDGAEVYVGYSEGQLKCYIYDDYEKRLEMEDILSKEPIDDIAIVASQGVVISTTDSTIHFHPTLKDCHRNESEANKGSAVALWKELDTEWERELGIKQRICLGKKKEISVFGNRFAVINTENTLEIYEISVTGDRLKTSKLCQVCNCATTLQWQLWQDSIILLLSSGEVVIYNTRGKPELVYKSEPYGLIIYKNPCWIFRDVIFCSTLSSGRLIVRTSYWLVGWDIGRRGRLYRALDQDKVNPTEDIWCVALRRRFLVCGTDWGRVSLYQLDQAENINGHSIVDLDVASRGTPVFSQKVGNGPVLQVDLAFQNGSILIYYKTSSNQLAFFKIDSMLCDRYLP